MEWDFIFLIPCDVFFHLEGVIFLFSSPEQHPAESQEMLFNIFIIYPLKNQLSVVLPMPHFFRQSLSTIQRIALVKY